MTDQLDVSAKQFFNSFVGAFATFDGQEVAKLFASQLMAVDSSGDVSVFTKSSDIAEYFQRYLDQYRSSGCESCGYDQLETVAMGPINGLATVTWALNGADRASMLSWRESYCLRRSGDRLFAYMTIDHGC